MAALFDTAMQIASTINAATSGSSQQSAAITGNGPYAIVTISVTQDTYVATGANPTASSTDSSFFPAGVVRTLKINNGDKIAYIQDSTAGRITIDVMV